MPRQSRNTRKRPQRIGAVDVLWTVHRKIGAAVADPSARGLGKRCCIEGCARNGGGECGGDEGEKGAEVEGVRHWSAGDYYGG